MSVQDMIGSGLPDVKLDGHARALAAMIDNLMTLPNANGEQKVVDNAENLGVILSMHPDIKDCFAHNILDGYNYVLAPIPGSSKDLGAKFEPRMLHETDYVAVQRWIQRSIPGFHRTLYQNVLRAVDEVCRAASFDPLLDWVNTCAESWDGKHRIEDLFGSYFVAAEQNQYSRELGKIAMMGQVLRAMQPGAPHRMTPVLEGKQGIGKSQGLAALCQDPKWFTDDVKNLGAKDTQDTIRKMFLVELAEMEVSRKADREQVKAFLTRRHETLRRAYARTDELYPRRCMFWGTTNEDNYLRDLTGNDRFFPIRIASVNVGAIRRDRDQLIGEAVQMLRECWAKELDWWEMSPEALAHLQTAREQAEDSDPWLPTVAAFVEGLNEVCTGMLMENYYVPPTKSGARREGLPKTELGIRKAAPTTYNEHRNNRKGLAIPKDRQTAYDARRISGILQKLGWRKDGLMPHDSAYPRITRFVPPDAE